MPAQPVSRPFPRSLALMVVTLFVCLLSAKPAHAASVTFQQGTTYTESEDVTLLSSQGGTNIGGETTVGVDGDQVLHVLTVFRDIFGASAGQVPTGSMINTATLTLWMVASPSEAENLRRMLRDA